MEGNRGLAKSLHLHEEKINCHSKITPHDKLVRGTNLTENGPPDQF